ncbi:tetratricopeptide repeat protein 7B-like [Saccoglossus kowalevskii]|uniref:Tetratricopeptide repeat protein 7B-like n=1 Tax=Saccoglossus kowalevskii TaxID=10224 RepID=A0ABM0M420_SACKO|nr:PREDICTED: tetratricopeptide repeat protein 7B-like [Saccoglossus kowalevskii]
MAASKKQTQRLETEIEKHRAECNWQKVTEIAKQLHSKGSTSLETLTHLILGESHLETYLKEHPLKEKNPDIAGAKKTLESAKKHLQHAMKGEAKYGWVQEARLLFGKLYYALSDYEECLGYYAKAGLDDLTVETMSNRKLRMIAEAFAVKGMALEKSPPKTTSKIKIAQMEEQIISCYEKSGDIALLYLQECEKGRSSSLSASSSSSAFAAAPSTYVGPLLETAIQRAPILHIQMGDLERGINRFRLVLRAVESRATQNMRMTLARQLAEVLLRGVCDSTYSPPQPPLGPDKSGSLSRPSAGGVIGTAIKVAGMKSANLALRPKQYIGEHLFVPKEVTEETLLLLLISESLATKEAILSRSEEHTKSRVYTLQNACAVYDLLTIALVKRAQYEMLSESFDRSMRFSFEEFHLWMQFALSLICAGKYQRALLVLRECHRMEPKNALVALHAAKLCFNHLQRMDEGIDWAKKVLELGDDSPYAHKGYQALGIGCSLKASEAPLQAERQELQKKALDAFMRAYSLDENNHEHLFYIGLQYALVRQISEAIGFVRKSLKLNDTHLESLHLLALLLSAQKKYQEALKVIEIALSGHPSNLSLLFTKVKLEEFVYDSEEALMTCKRMLELWKSTHESMLSNESSRGTGLLERVTSDKRSLAHIHLVEFSDRDSAAKYVQNPPKSSVHNSIAASRVEQALSEVASSIHSYTPRQGPQQAWLLQVQIWLTIAEIYLSMKKPDEATACIQEASSIFPLSHHVMFMRGLVHEYKHEFLEAKKFYSDAVSINPGHIKSLQHLGVILHDLGNSVLAEKVLRNAVNMDPTSHHAWNSLGKVLECQDEFDSASQCLLTAVELESTSPIIPFTAIPRLL